MNEESTMETPHRVEVTDAVGGDVRIDYPIEGDEEQATQLFGAIVAELQALEDEHGEERESAEDLQSRDRCPWCGGAVEQTSVDPLEEYCIDAPCDYYRAEGVDGVIRE